MDAHCCKGAADFIFYGNIITIDDRNPTAEAVAVRGEEIVYVGQRAGADQFKGPKTTVVELTDGKTLMPGLIEAHSHPLMYSAIKLVTTDVSGFDEKSSEKVDDIMKEAVKKAEEGGDPNAWLLFFGWDVALIRDLPTLNKQYLDDNYTTKFPMLVIAQNGHMGWVNQTTFDKCGITESSSCTYIDYDKGIVKEAAGMSEVLKHYRPNPAMVQESISHFLTTLKVYAQSGFTTVAEMSVPTIHNLSESGLYLVHKDLLSDLPSTFSKLEFNLLHCRLGMYFVDGVPSYLDNLPNFSDRLWIGGSKFFSDGSPYSGTMAVAEDYLDTDLTRKLSFDPKEPKGRLNHDEERITQLITEVHKRGKYGSVCVHTHGESAIDQILNAYKKSLKGEETSGDFRYRMEHLGLITDDQVQRAAELGVTLTFYPDHIYYYGEALADDILGSDRANRFTPVGWAKKYDHKFTLHEDTPCSPLHPFISMQSAVTRKSKAGKEYNLQDDDLRIEVIDALKAYTINAAWQLMMDDKIGSIEVGKKADLVVLSADPLNIPPDQLGTVNALATFCGGSQTSGSV